MLTEETGTGKELAAQSLHSLSIRRDNRFVSQNCAAIPESLLESILFGTVKGAYTGAENTAGLFSALNENPIDCIKNGKLRRDLFYRLSTVEIDIEPLRKRKEDISYMTDYYINYFNKRMNRAITGIDEEVRRMYLAESACTAKLRSMISAGWPSAAAMLTSLPSAMTFTHLPLGSL